MNTREQRNKYTSNLVYAKLLYPSMKKQKWRKTKFISLIPMFSPPVYANIFPIPTKKLPFKVNFEMIVLLL